MFESERRKQSRIAHRFRAWTWDGAQQHVAETIDVGTGGACLRVAPGRTLRTGDELRLRLELDEGQAPVEVDAQVRWSRDQRVGVQFRGRLPAVFAACLAALTGLQEVQAAEEEVPSFDENKTIVLDDAAGGERPDEYRVLSAFQQQYEALDHCVAAAKARRRAKKQLPGDVEMHVLLNPKGKRPLGINALLPKPVVRDRRLRRCLKAAVAKAPYPGYDGPPVVVELNFELDPGSVYVED